MRKVNSLFLAVAALGVAGASIDASPLGTQNRVAILRVGDGAASQTGTGAVFLDEYAITYTAGIPTGATHVQTISVPATGAANAKLTIGNTAAAEGGLNFSTNGQYLMFGGYDTAVNQTASGSTARRMVGRIDLAGNVTTDAIYGTGTNTANNAIRSITSTDGSQYWAAFSANGVQYRTWEGGDNSAVNSVQLSSTNTNTRRMEISGGQLYTDLAAGTIQGVATVGTGLPTTTGQTITSLPGFPTATGPSPYDFFFANSTTLYVADDRTNTSGGLQKWALESGTWVLKYTKNIDTTNDTFDNGLRGLTGSVSPDGTVTLFGTSTYSTTGAANFLVGISDSLTNTSAASVTVNSLASSATIPTAGGSLATFRGLEAIGISVPEPTSLSFIAGGLTLLATRRRRV